MSSDLIGRRVACVTNYGDVYTGTMVGVDGQHNLSLENVVIGAYPSTSSTNAPPKTILPQPSNPIRSMFIRGSSVLYIDLSA